MALPKIQSPVFEIEIPSFHRTYDFRPFLVKEEKILLMAQQSDSNKDILKAIKQIINNCCLSEDLNIDNLTMTDIEYIFLKLRSRSVNNIIEVKYRDREDEKEYTFKIDLEEVQVTHPESINNNIQLGNGIGMIMKHPTASVFGDADDLDDDLDDVLNFFIKKCIVEIYDEETVYPVSEHTDEELQTFIDSIDTKSFEKVKEFIDAAPKLTYTIKYKNSLGNDREIVLDTLRDFFTLG